MKVLFLHLLILLQNSHALGIKAPSFCLSNQSLNMTDWLLSDSDWVSQWSAFNAVRRQLSGSFWWRPFLKDLACQLEPVCACNWLTPPSCSHRYASVWSMQPRYFQPKLPWMSQSDDINFKTFNSSLTSLTTIRLTKCLMLLQTIKLTHWQEGWQ